MTTRSDIDRVLDMWSALGLGETSDTLEVVTIPGAPWSKARPRFTRRGITYRPKDDMDAEIKTGNYLKSVVKQPYTGNVGIVCLFFRPNHQRIDTDNLIKHVCDAANGILWQDDSQCTGVMGVIELDADNPRTVVGIGKHVSTLKRGSDDTTPCQACGKPISRSKRQRDRRPQNCSRQCAAISKGHQSLSEPVQCGKCGKSFKRITAAQKLCSAECRKEFVRNRPKGIRSRSRCLDCDKELAHNRGGRCRDCWRQHTAKAHKLTDLSGDTGPDQKSRQRSNQAAKTTITKEGDPC